MPAYINLCSRHVSETRVGFCYANLLVGNHATATCASRKPRGAPAAEGDHDGPKPYGTLPAETEVVQRMKELRGSGLGFDKIAAALNAQGMKTRRGKRWWGLAVNKIRTRET